MNLRTEGPDPDSDIARALSRLRVGTEGPDPSIARALIVSAGQRG